MKNAKSIVLALLFIFLISGSYAIYTSGGDVLGITASDEVQNNNPAPASNVSNVDKSIKTDIVNNIEDKVMGQNPAVDSMTLKYAIKYGAGKDLSLNESTIDRFIQCICGRFAPYGEVSKQLPEEALCPYIQNNYVGTGNPDADHAYTYDEAMAIWERDGASSLESIKQYSDLGLDIHTDDLPENDVQVPSQPKDSNENPNIEPGHYEYEIEILNINIA